MSEPYCPKTFGDDLARVIEASRVAEATRVCLLATRDRDHAMHVVKDAVSRTGRPLYHFTVAGRYHYDVKAFAWTVVSTESTDAPALLAHAEELKGGGVVVFEDCLSGLDDRNGNQRMRMLLARLLSAETRMEGLVLVFLEPPAAETHLPSILADQFVRLEVPYPRAHELEDIASKEVAAATSLSGQTIEPEQARRNGAWLATGLVGLTRSAARDALRDALAPDPGDLDGGFARLQRRKRDQLHRDLAMNVLDTSDVEEPVGLEYLIDHLNVGRDRMRSFGADRARGVLLIGPPGTGKTMLARAIGRLVDLPVVDFRISSLMNSYLGETERRFARAFDTLEAMAPNVVFIDEIEKAFGGSSERDGGTMMRCTGSLLTWLSENPYPNFIVATSNSLERMGDIGLTMTRSERFDAAFFVDVPSHGARRAMLERWLANTMPDPPMAAEELAAVTEKFSGADLRSAVKQATSRAEHERRALTIEHLKTEMERRRMRTLALHDTFNDLRRWAGNFCEPAGPTD